MFRRILSVCIAAGLALIVLVATWPAAAQDISQRIVRGIVAVETGKVTLISEEPVIKVVDPEAISTTIAKEGSDIIAIFKKNTSSTNGTLSINDIIDATNNERIKAGLEPLKVSTRLTESAQLKTDDMIAQHYFEHTSPDGKSVSDLGNEVGYAYIVMGENLALGNFTDANDLVQAWMNSPGHRANILNPLYQDIGIYAAKGTYDGRVVWFAVQHFGVARAACPVVSTTLKAEIDATNASLTNQQIRIEQLRGEIEAMNPGDPHYPDLVREFDTLVDAYNSQLDVSRVNITEYNRQVKTFNDCLSKYQK